MPIELIKIFGSKTNWIHLLKIEIISKFITPWIRYFYPLSQPSEGWDQFKGFVTLDMMKTIFP